MAFWRHRPPETLLCAIGLLVSLSVPSTARAEPAGEEIDTEHLFGFTEGSDITPLGERELESESTARVGKRAGRYHALDSALTVKLPVLDHVRVAPGVSFAQYHVKGVPALDDRTLLDLSGGFLETRA